MYSNIHTYIYIYIYIHTYIHTFFQMEGEFNERIHDLQREVDSTQNKLHEARTMLNESAAREMKISRSMLQVRVYCYVCVLVCICVCIGMYVRLVKKRGSDSTAVSQRTMYAWEQHITESTYLCVCGRTHGTSKR